MKYCEVKTKKQIYLGFSQIAHARRNLIDIISLQLFFRNLFFDRLLPRTASSRLYHFL